jgi:GR25 family glycosyltransferase involved in LPS biosynthesis
MTILILLFLYILIITSCIIDNEYFEQLTISDKIDFFVISLHSDERTLNITNQNKQLNAYLTIISAINGVNINQEQLFQNNVLAPTFFDKNNIKRNKEIGCYMSHILTFNTILNNLNKKKIFYCIRR